MGRFRLKFGVLILILFLILIFYSRINKESYAINSNVDPMMWTYVDGLGRSAPIDVVKSNKVRLVGIFYWTWHMELNGPGPFNLNNIIEEHPEAKNDYNSSVWQKYNTSGYYWWNESIYGYYRENDDYVLRKQAELLADAGVDFVAFDCTNGAFTWEDAYENLLEVWLEAANDGVDVPKVAFMFPFGYSSTTTAVSFMNVYNNLYNPNSSNFKKYHSLLFDYNGKYLVLMNDYEKASTEIKNILSKYFEVRKNYPAYFTSGAKANGSWGWLSTYPQAYYKKANGEPEQMSVGVSMNASYSTQKLTAMNGKDIMGRSYAKDNYSYSYKYRNQTINVGSSITGSTAKDTNTSLYGRNFQQQWDHALSIDPEVVFVTGWNEWIVSRFENWEGTKNAFPDQFNDEYSRDIEPSKGTLKDNYYYQLVDNIRKYKGTKKMPSQDKVKKINQLTDWKDDEIISYNHYVGGENRNIVGFGTTNPVTYVNDTFRNDIRTSKVSYDESYIYFYVETVENLTSYTDDKWMRLLIDTTDSINSSSLENWEEFEYIINRDNITNKTMVVEKSVGGWNFEVVGEVDYVVSNNVLQIKVPRVYLGLTNNEIKFNFKWCDNNLDNGDIMTLYTNGDSAPGGRFAFQFSGKADYSAIDNGEVISFDSSLDVNIEKKYINLDKISMSIFDLLEKININNNSAKIYIYSKDKVLKDENNIIATGDKLCVYINGEKIDEYLFSVLGDVNGDGKITVTDVANLFQRYRNNITMENIYIVSGDVLKDSEIKLTDVAKLFQYVRGKISDLR